MASEKPVSTRIQQKHDIEANWLKAINFIPKDGEIIIYDVDDNHELPRLKIGDGITNVNSLPFIEKQMIALDDGNGNITIK